MRLRRVSVALGCALAISSTAAQAALRQFSYDPADAETRAAAGGVTFLIRQSMLGVRVLKMRATEAKAAADLSRADPDVLGRGGLARALGQAAPEHEFYQILPADEGPAFVAALCPGSKQGWVALTPVRYGQDLQAVVFGDDPAGGPARRCRTLAFTFHGEWRLPTGSGPSVESSEPPGFPN
ncbi:MAG TPA: hypothetical protein VGF33_03750 [Caulobacteraceae bacterium]|jgi:hypothetical protein